jgi:hypothetical protein
MDTRPDPKEGRSDPEGRNHKTKKELNLLDRMTVSQHNRKY